MLNYKKTGLPYLRGDINSEDLKLEINPSLFLGNSGIGYFLLRAIAPDKVSSILAPIINLKNDKKVSLSQFQIKVINKLLIEKQFKRSVCILEKILPEEFDNFLNEQDAFSNKNALRKFVLQNRTKLTKNHRLCLMDIFNLEIKKTKIENTITRNLLLVFSEKYEAECIQNILHKDDGSLLKQKFVLMHDCIITNTKWNWSSSSKKKWICNLSLKSQKQWLLLQSKADGILEEYIFPLTAMLLYAFKEPTSVEQAIKQTTEYFGSISNEEKTIIKAKLLEQIKQAAKSGILMVYHIQNI